MKNTSSFDDLGFREIKMLSQLLMKYVENPGVLGSKVKWELNPSSGNVFLYDEHYRIAMLNGDDLEQFYSCPECGIEGFKEDMLGVYSNECCKDYVEEE